MRCHEVRKHTSEYIDRFLGGAERERVLEHLAGCANCRAHVEATRRVIDSLRTVSAPMVPTDLFERTIVAIDREAEPATTIVTRRHFRLRPRYHGTVVQIGRQLLLTYEFNLISYGVALCISFVMFTSLLASVRPLLSVSPFLAPSAQEFYVDAKQAVMLTDAKVPDVYSLPKISNGDELSQFVASDESSRSSDLVLVAQVATDGRGSIVEVVDGRRDNRSLGELASVLNRPKTFSPARATSGRPVASLVVIGLYHVDVWE